jgi:hypothetical protein
MINPYRFSQGALPATPFAYYKFDETSGTTAVDSENSNDITGTESDMWNVYGHLNGGIQESPTTSTAHFDMSATISNNFISNGVVTVCQWVQVDSTSNSFETIDRDFVFRINRTTTRYRILIGNSTSTGWAFDSFTPSDTALITSGWYHLAVAISLSDYKIYENGVLIYTGSYTARTGWGTPADTFRIGEEPVDLDNSQAWLDEMVLYSRILTVGEINQIMDAT